MLSYDLKKKWNCTVGYCLYQFIIYDPINLKYMYYVTVSLGCNKGCQIPISSPRCGLVSIVPRYDQKRALNGLMVLSLLFINLAREQILLTIEQCLYYSGNSIQETPSGPEQVRPIKKDFFYYSGF